MLKAKEKDDRRAHPEKEREKAGKEKVVRAKVPKTEPKTEEKTLQNRL